MRGVGRFGPLRERQFRLLWFARTGSAVGDSLIPVALSGPLRRSTCCSLSLCLMPAGQLLAGPISGAVGVDATLVLAGTLICVPNFLVLVFVQEVRSVERREMVEPEPAALATTAG